MRSVVFVVVVVVKERRKPPTFESKGQDDRGFLVPSPVFPVSLTYT
jgi:hypothetical protein